MKFSSGSRDIITLIAVFVLVGGGTYALTSQYSGATLISRVTPTATPSATATTTAKPTPVVTSTPEVCTVDDIFPPEVPVPVDSAVTNTNTLTAKLPTDTKTLVQKYITVATSQSFQDGLQKIVNDPSSYTSLTSMKSAISSYLNQQIANPFFTDSKGLVNTYTDGVNSDLLNYIGTQYQKHSKLFHQNVDYSRDWNKGDANLTLNADLHLSSIQLSGGGSISITGVYHVLGDLAAVKAQYDCGFHGSAFGSFSAYGKGSASINLNLSSKKFGQFAVPLSLSWDGHSYSAKKNWSF